MNQTEAREGKGQRVSKSEGGYGPQNLRSTAANRRSPIPSACERQQWSRQEQGQQKQEMFGSLGNVTNAEAKSSGESAQCEALRSNRSGVSEGHLIERLVLVAALRFQLKTLVLRHEAVYEIDGDATLVMILEG